MKSSVLEQKEKQTKSIAQAKEKGTVISYRMKCGESGNGLSHYIMYGDLPEERR